VRGGGDRVVDMAAIRKYKEVLEEARM